MDLSLFASRMSSSLGSGGSHTNPALSRIIDSLQEMYASFYSMNRRTITPENLALMERDLRTNIRELDGSLFIKGFVMSVDEALSNMNQVRDRLDLAADILLQPGFSVSRRKQLYQCYNEICAHLNEAIIILQKT
jgi:hypothetical protein